MPYTVDIGTLLDNVRTAIGATTTVDGTDYTWKRMVEGPPLRWMGAVTDYPLICIDPEETEVMDGAMRDEHETPVAVYAVIQPNLAPAARVYTVLRELGEQLINDLMSAADRIGNERRLIRYGVDDEVMGEGDFFDRGFGVYRIVLGVKCWVEDVNP